MIITKEVTCWITPVGVETLYLCISNYAKSMPMGHVGYVDSSMSLASLSVFPGAAAPIQQLLPRKGYTQSVLVYAPTENVQAFSLTSVSGTRIVGGREDPNWDFQVRVVWEVLHYREGSWHFIEQPVYLKHLRVNVEYAEHEQRALRGVLGYDPFRQMKR